MMTDLKRVDTDISGAPSASLLIDTTAATILGVFDTCGSLLSGRTVSGKQADGLDQLVQEVLEEASCRPRDISQVLAARGPGSFTGLRVGIAYAQGFAMQGPLPVFAFNSFVPLFCRLGHALGSASIISAKRGYVYLGTVPAGSEPGSGGIEERLLPESQFLEQAVQFTRLVSAGFCPVEARFGGALPQIIRIEDGYPFEDVYMHVIRHTVPSTGSFGAHYVQPPAAEEKRLQRAAERKLG